MKRTLLVFVLLVLLGCLFATDFTYSGYISTRGAMYNDIYKDSPTTSYMDTRFSMESVFAADENLKAVWKFQLGSASNGYVQWGNPAEGGGIDTRGVNMQTVNAYLQYACPMTKFDWKVGLQWWGDHRSLVWDDDFSAITGIRKLNDNLNLELGMAKLSEGNIDAYDDTDLWLINFTSEKMGLQNLIADMNGSGMEFWIMPYVVLGNEQMKVDLMAAIDYAKANENVGDYSSFGWAFTAKGTFQMKPILGFDVLIASGEDYKDANKGKAFHSISDWYQSGLTIFGRGTNHEHATVGWYDSNNDDHGIMSLVGTFDYPMNENTNIVGALGYVSAMQKENSNGTELKGTGMGIEFNAGMKYKMAEALSFGVIGAYAIPGDAYEPADPDNLFQLNGLLKYDF